MYNTLLCSYAVFIRLLIYSCSEFTKLKQSLSLHTITQLRVSHRQSIPCSLVDSPLLVLEKILMLVGEELDEERKIPLKLRRRGDLGGEF